MTTQSPVFPTLLITEQVVKSNSFPSSALRSQGHLPSLDEMRWRMSWMCFKKIQTKRQLLLQDISPARWSLQIAESSLSGFLDLGSDLQGAR